MDYFEGNLSEDRLYDREVSAFLFTYIMRYKRYLFLGLGLVVIVTSVSLAVPYFSKIILDRYVIKSGYVVRPDLLTYENAVDSVAAGFSEKKLRTGVAVGDGSYFFLKSQLRFFSEKQIETLRKSGVFSDSIAILVEMPKKERAGPKRILDSLVAGGGGVQLNETMYAVSPSVYERLPVTQILQVRGGDFSMVVRIALAAVLLFILQFFATYYQNINLMKLSQYAMRDLRLDLFKRILSYEVTYFDTNPIGKLVNRVSNDIEVLNEMFSSVLVNLFQDMVLLVGITIIMFRENVYLALCVAITFPLIAIFTIVFRIKSSKAYHLIRECTSRLNAFFSETISGIRIVQIFIAEAKHFNKFSRINTELYKANIGQLQIVAVFRPLIDFLRWFAIASVLYFGAHGILDGMISYGVLVLFLQYIGSFFEPVSDLSEKFDIMVSANAAGEKILSVIKATARIEKEPSNQFNAQKATSVRGLVNAQRRIGSSRESSMRLNGALAFEHVWFSYKADEWVLRDVTFSVEPKQTVAFVGETGSGKSTIISLLGRFWEPHKGTISLDNVSLTALSYDRIRGNIAFVMQDVFLFSTTVRDNIILNAPYDEERFRMVCSLTHVDSFISRLPHKELEPVMERGVTFSAGERQLLSFARALYFDPSILILDEATSYIDSETEQLIQDAISHLIENRTAIVIAHRLSTIRHADNIFVIEKGKIAESGNHRALIEKRGIYYNLYQLQFQPI
ncbi:MAG: ABC transporter ATP-binding protein [Chitinivibrionales bacterium]|nr:ABC transporter ATP-binding protein [Chitinivibrionales bacterium]